MSVAVLSSRGDRIGQPFVDTGPVKNQLRSLWAQVLEQDVSDFSEADAFFEVGGDSVRALELATAAQAQGILLTVEQIFVHATLEEMSREALASSIPEDGVRKGNEGPQAFSLLAGKAIQTQIQAISEACNVDVDRIEDAYPCTPMQESLVSLSEGNENLSMRQLVYRLDDDVSLESFQRAWDATAYANPILRTRICQPKGQLRLCQAVVDEDILWNHSSTNLSQFLEEDVNNPMRLGGRLFRFTFITDNSQRYFVWTVHHALCDGSSLLNLLNDVSSRFRGKSDLERTSFAKFIESTVQVDSDQERTFWQRIFSDIDVTTFPTLPYAADFHASPSKTIERPIILPNGSLFGITKALLLRAAWGILLSHYTGTENVVFGVINNGRISSSVSGISEITGPTINLLPIVVRVDPKQTVGSLLTSVRSQAAELMAFEHTGVSKIRSYLARSESAVTDFQNIFVVHPAEFGDAGAPSLEKLGIQYMDSLGKTEQHAYPLVVSLTLSTETTAMFKIQYDERVISTKQAENLIHQFQAVLSQLGNATASTLLESISSFSDHDLSQIREWNRDTPPAINACIHHLFEEQVRKNPGAEAVCSLERSLTYAEVDGIASALALRLVETGVKLETPVAVCFDKSIWTVVAILSVFKAGGVYVPIDPAHPRGRIIEVMQTVNINVGIASKTSAAVLRGLCDHLIEIDGSEQSTTKESLPEDIRTRVQPSNTAYLLFTSGSTGKPKGVLIPHSAMSTSIMHHGPAFGASTKWRTLQFAAHTFDISMTEFCTTLAFGGCVCVPTEHDRMNDLAGAITALKVNTALVVPTVANLLSPDQVPGLETLVLGGEPVTKDTISKWASHVNLIAGYGPSETAVYCSGNLNASADAHPADIGRCIGGTMWIVNPEDHNRLSAIGCVGEIAITGAIVGNGYFGDPATTEKAFVPAPEWLQRLHPDMLHKKMYKTGDLGRYNSDGTFRIIGRNDTQVKLRGFRIELGEIENRIKESSLVVAALATLPSKGPCAHRIVAVVSLNRSDLGNHGVESNSIHLAEDQQKGVLDQIKSQISLKVPDYMVPSIWINLEKFPLLLSGKIDRRLLKTWIEQMSPETFEKLAGNSDAGEAAEVEPGTTADAIRGIWGEILNTSPNKIGMRTSFFSLGGDSIAAIQVVSKARRIGLSVTTANIIRQETLGNLATLVDQNKQIVSKDAEQIIGPQGIEGTRAYASILRHRLERAPEVEIEDSYPFTPIQREILRQREINPAVFVLSWKMEFTSLKSQPVSLERLAEAWNLVVQKHHILRSVFVKDPEGVLPLLQVVLRKARPSIATSSTSLEQHESTMDELLPALDECFLPHRAHFYRRGDRYFGHIELDHLVIDGWSFRLIKEDLLAAYDHIEAELSPPQYAFKAVVRAHQPSRINADKEYWASILHGQRQSRLSFPVNLSSSEAPPSPTKTVIYLPEFNIAALSAFSTSHSVTPASIIDAAWAQTLSLFTGSPDVTYEYVVSNRDLDVDGIFEIVGPVMNLLAYHLHDVSTETTPQELANLANQIQDQRLQDGGHTVSNLREILQEDLKMELPFNTALNFQRRPLGVQTDSLKVYDHLRQSSDPWHFDVLVRILHITDDNIVRPSIEFDARLFDEKRMNEVADVFWSKVQVALDK